MQQLWSQLDDYKEGDKIKFQPNVGSNIHEFDAVFFEEFTLDRICYKMQEGRFW